MKRLYTARMLDPGRTRPWTLPPPSHRARGDPSIPAPWEQGSFPAVLPPRVPATFGLLPRRTRDQAGSTPDSSIASP